MLHEADFEAEAEGFFSECCSFKLVATLQDLSFCAIHFEQFNL